MTCSVAAIAASASGSAGRPGRASRRTRAARPGSPAPVPGRRSTGGGRCRPDGRRPPPATAAPGSVGRRRARGRRPRGVGVPRNEGVGLRPHLHPEVVDADGHGSRKRTPSGSSAEARTTRSSARGVQRPACRVRTPRPRPRRSQRHRPPPQARRRVRSPRPRPAPRCRASAAAGRGRRGPALEAELVDEQRGGLGHPVRVRRRRELHALTGGVVVEGDQRSAGVLLQASREHRGERDIRLCIHAGEDRVPRMSVDDLPASGQWFRRAGRARACGRSRAPDPPSSSTT